MRMRIGSVLVGLVLATALGCSSSEKVATEATAALDQTALPSVDLAKVEFQFAPSTQLVAPFRSGWVALNAWAASERAPGAVWIGQDGRSSVLPDPPDAGGLRALVPLSGSVAYLAVDCVDCSDASIGVHLLDTKTLEWLPTPTKLSLKRPLGEEGAIELIGYHDNETVLSVGGQLYVLGDGGTLEELQGGLSDGRATPGFCMAKADGVLFEVGFQLVDDQTRDGALPEDPESYIGQVTFVPQTARKMSLDGGDRRWVDVEPPPIEGALESPQILCGLSGPIVAGPRQSFALSVEGWNVIDAAMPDGTSSTWLGGGGASTSGEVVTVSSTLRRPLTLSESGWSLLDVEADAIVVSDTRAIAIRSDNSFEVIQLEGKGPR